MWQDYVYTVGGLFFSFAVLRMVRDPHTQVPRSSSIPTSALLMLYAFTNYSLGLHFSALVQALVASMWAGVAIWRPIRAGS